MNFLSTLKSKVIALVITVGIILIAIFNFGLGGKAVPLVNDSKTAPVDSSQPQLISTNPSELFEKKPMVFPPDQVIELNFNVELENGPETKLTFDPPAEVKVDITNNGKTAKITPAGSWKLGQGYTITIKPETKIRGGKTLGREFNVHFNVINYSGI